MPNLLGRRPVGLARTFLALLIPETFQTGTQNSLLSTRRTHKVQESDKNKNQQRHLRSKLPKKNFVRAKKSERDQNTNRSKNRGSSNSPRSCMISIGLKLGLKRLNRKNRNLLNLRKQLRKTLLVLTITSATGLCHNREPKRWILIVAIFSTTARALQHN